MGVSRTVYLGLFLKCKLKTGPLFITDRVCANKHKQYYGDFCTKCGDPMAEVKTAAGNGYIDPRSQILARLDDRLVLFDPDDDVHHYWASNLGVGLREVKDSFIDLEVGKPSVIDFFNEHKDDIKDFEDLYEDVDYCYGVLPVWS